MTDQTSNDSISSSKVYEFDRLNQSINQPISQSINQSINSQSKQSKSWLLSQIIEIEWFDWLSITVFELVIIMLQNQSSINQTINQSMNQSIIINQPINHQFKLDANQPINQSINQSICQNLNLSFYIGWVKVSSWWEL